MGFDRHKRVVGLLLLAELAFALFPALEQAGLYALLGLIYLAVSYWFVFGEPGWWPYRYAGIAYVVILTLQFMAASLQLAMPPLGYHLGLALLWAAVLTVHRFAEREFPRR